MTGETQPPPASPRPRIPRTPDSLRGMNETAPWYLALVGAQLLPFLTSNRGIVVDCAYFTVTAVATLIVGTKRFPLQSAELTAPLSKKQAIIAPFAASTSLFSLYLLLKYTQIDVNMIFGFFTTVVAGLCFKEAFDPVVNSAYQTLGLQNQAIYDIEKPEFEGEAIAKLYATDIISAVVSLAVVVCYVGNFFPGLTFVFGNALAVGIGARVLSLIRPDSFLVAAGLLTGLCLYDIFWVLYVSIAFLIMNGRSIPDISGRKRLEFATDDDFIHAAAS
jgi:Signal peptide peptidase